MAEALALYLHGEADRAVIELVGTLDGETGGLLDDVVQQLLSESRTAPLIELRCGGVTTADEAGIALLTRLQRDALEAGRVVALTAVTGSMKHRA